MTFTLDGNRYDRCVCCKTIINILNSNSKHFVCKKCRSLLYKKLPTQPKLSLAEQRLEVVKIMNIGLKSYFKSMEKEYEIKNKS